MALIAGCSSSNSDSKAAPPPTGQAGVYTLSLVGFQPHAGQMVQLKLKDDMGMVYGNANGTVGADGTLVLTIPKALEDGMKYRADFFVDNFPAGAPNGFYDAPTNPTDVANTIRDHGWRLEIEGSAAGVQSQYKHDAHWTDLAPF